MPSLAIVILTTFLCYIMQYILCFVVDKREIEKHEKKIKPNKYTEKLFFYGIGMKNYIGWYIL